MSFIYSSSVRQIPIAETLQLAKSFARNLQITRVTNVTRLDRVGVPVFCSIRPGAQAGSLCVNAGKGLSEEEAQIGAYMEAIEFAMAEYGTTGVKTIAATVRDLACNVQDFCPLQNKAISLSGPIHCVEAEELLTGKQQLIPAQLVYLPFPEDLKGIRVFAATSNGLSSGNSILEATIHGIAEIIERDITSFQTFRNTSAFVLPDSYSDPIQNVARAVNDAGLRLFVRYCPNEFNIPLFKAVVCDLMEHNPIYVSAGFGCHTDRNIAITRAVCESLQSRLSFIHGGRDDLTKRYREFHGWDQARIQHHTTFLIQRAASNVSTISFDQVLSSREQTTKLDEIFATLINVLSRAGFSTIYRVALTKPTDPLHVVRILIPKMEFYDPLSPRVGVRLANVFKQ